MLLLLINCLFIYFLKYINFLFFSIVYLYIFLNYRKHTLDYYNGKNAEEFIYHDQYIIAIDAGTCE